MTLREHLLRDAARFKAAAADLDAASPAKGHTLGDVARALARADVDLHPLTVIAVSGFCHEMACIRFARNAKQRVEHARLARRVRGLVDDIEAMAEKA